MRFLDAEFVQGFICMANDGWELGWHERNGGNLSYRVKPEEVESVKENASAQSLTTYEVDYDLSDYIFRYNGYSRASAFFDYIYIYRNDVYYDTLWYAYYGGRIPELTVEWYKDGISIDDAAKEYLAQISGNDLRFAYNLLEIAYYASEDKIIDIELIKKVNNKPNLFLDKNGDNYYNIISAFQKSIRGSDVNASLHYLARLIEAEDLDIIVRRLSVIVYEDIGLANPSMGPRVDAAINAALRLGLPEARIPLSEIVIELALSPKSNSAELAIDQALNDVRSGNIGDVPNHLKNPSPDYKYPHNYKNDYVKQQYMPDNLIGKEYYHPKNNKNEKILKEIINRLKEI